MVDFTFLSEDEIVGKDKLDIFKKRNARTVITDFTVLLGGYVSDWSRDDSGDLDKRVGNYWTRTNDGYNDVRVVSCSGLCDNYLVFSRLVGARPTFSFSQISDIPTNGVSRRASDGVLEIEYGYYPKRAVDSEKQKTLYSAFRAWELQNLGDVTIATDSRKSYAYSEKFSLNLLNVYDYLGKKYVRVKANLFYSPTILSNGLSCQTGDYVWVEVEPVTWWVDEKAKKVICENIVFAGVQFNNVSNYKGDFSKTDIKKFMDEYFAKDLVKLSSMEQNNVLDNEQTEDVENEVSIRKKNPYNFNFDNVSEEDIIRGAIESNVAVFLHGRSSEGKSARVKQLDPDCEIIYLRNATPDSLNGKSVYDSVTHEMIDIPPTWLKKITKKCEAEPDKIHIVFFDEITNALPSIQGMAFNIVLDGEVNGIWKLPSNCRIVAAGNDLKDSLAANTMAEPLFNRFAHVYINTTVDSWLKWATTPKKQYERLDYETSDIEATIHPAIVAYITYKSYLGDDVLRTKYNGETPNADPRKWEMASKVLYTTKQPEMLRALIGEDLTRDFASFARQQVISIDDVIKGNYSDRDIKIDLAEKYATAVGLSSVDDNNLEVVRDFVMKMGPEVVAIFDVLWIHGDENRLERMAELKMAEESKGGVRR